MPRSAVSAIRMLKDKNILGVRTMDKKKIKDIDIFPMLIILIILLANQMIKNQETFQYHF